MQAGLAHTDTNMIIDQPQLGIIARVYRTSKHIVCYSWLNILLIAVPVGVGVRYAGINPVAAFVVNAIAIVPLARLLSYATECVARTLGDTVGALMNVTFGNAVELIIL